MPWGTWKPTKIERTDTWVGTSTRVVVVKTDQGQGYLKAMGNPAGEPALACELVGCSLAEWIGLVTPHFATVHVDDDEGDLFLEPEPEAPSAARPRALPGPAFISKTVTNADTWSGDPAQLVSLDNAADIAGLVVVDTWLGNGDRFPRRPADGRRREPNLGNVLLGHKGERSRRRTLYAIDYSECLHRKDGGIRRSFDLSHVRDEGIYGLFDAFAPYVTRRNTQPFLDRLRRQSLREDLKGIVSRIPHEWCVDSASQQAVVSFLCDRAAYLAEEFWNRLNAVVPTAR
jgi:hypothetical protein